MGFHLEVKQQYALLLQPTCETVLCIEVVMGYGDIVLGILMSSSHDVWMVLAGTVQDQ
jgi:hypothetical protein